MDMLIAAEISTVGAGNNPLTNDNSWETSDDNKTEVFHSRASTALLGLTTAHV
jgi:hypothetical protein